MRLAPMRSFSGSSNPSVANVQDQAEHYVLVVGWVRQRDDIETRIQSVATRAEPNDRGMCRRQVAQCRITVNAHRLKQPVRDDIETRGDHYGGEDEAERALLDREPLAEPESPSAACCTA